MMNSIHTIFRRLIPLFFVGIFLLVAFNGSSEEPDLEDPVAKNKPEVPVINRSSASAFSDELPLFDTWETFGVEDGLPSNKITTVRIGQGRVWVGTDKGLAIFEDGGWKVITTEDGLSHNYILGIDISEMTGEVWIATMSGLNRWSAGEIEVYNQFNSGLANDVVYYVICDRQFVWAATAAGASRFNIYTGQWVIFNQNNAPMHEPWTYGVTDGGDQIYIAAWGGGVLEYFKDSGRFRVHRDPDHQMEIDLYPDDGLVHDITSAVTYDDGVLWVGTYFGLSRYDGKRWQGYFDSDSGLASNFINFVKAQGPVVYICTDKGLSIFNGTRWATYRSNGTNGEIVIRKDSTTKTINTSTSIPDNYIWSVDVSGDEIWVATDDGLARAKASGKLVL